MASTYWRKCTQPRSSAPIRSMGAFGRTQKMALAFGAASVGVLAIAYGTVPWVALSLACSFGLYGFLKKTTWLDGVRLATG